MECFFITGGILTAKRLNKEFKNDINKLKWIGQFWIKRFFRIVPVTALIVILTLTSNSEIFAPYSFGFEKENCMKFWWMALAMNFIDVSKQFASHIWYVSVFLQLTLAAPFVFLAIRHKTFGNFITTFVLAASTVLRFSHTFSGFYDKALVKNGFLTHFGEIVLKYQSLQYRLLPFFGGMILEQYWNNRLKKFQIRIWKISVLLMILATTLNICGRLQLSILTSILDIILMYCLLVLIDSCHHSNGRVKKFLSRKFWSTISKMGLSIYLFSGHIQFTIYERQLEPLEVKNELHFISMFFVDIVKMSIPILLTFLLIDEPFSAFGEFLARIFFLKS
ncbi:hypothetical protein ACKWTF_016181 [Chironomus riparius]